MDSTRGGDAGGIYGTKTQHEAHGGGEGTCGVGGCMAIVPILGTTKEG